MANLVGVAKFLATHRQDWQGTVMFVGQPAEERVGGARAMLDDGLYRRFGRPDFALALHVSPQLPTGTIAYRGGFAMANVDSADITVRGVGGHGAYPHTTVDPIVQAAQLVLSLQTIVSREVNPIESAVVTIGSIHGGSKHNIISNQCHLQLTIRSYSQDVRKQILAAIERTAKGVAMAAGAPMPTIKFTEGTDAVFNNVDLVERLVPVFRRSLGEEKVVEAPPTMGAEDFGMYARDGVPILMFWLGSISPERLSGLSRPLSLHSPLYYPDIRPTLVTGITAMSAAALDLLSKND
jgi:hippurate hydrolase